MDPPWSIVLFPSKSIHVSNTKSHRWSSCLKPWNFCKSAEVFDRERGWKDDDDDDDGGDDDDDDDDDDDHYHY